jgi:SAM-dependent methyltransferase
MRLNLGCGRDIRVGYTNVDFIEPEVSLPPEISFQLADLSKMPWPWLDSSADEVMMLDFLEHFPYRETDTIIQECWRVLTPGGKLTVQVPDFEHCAKAILASGNDDGGFQCNRCGRWLCNQDECSNCGQSYADIQDAAIHRLYGGQNVKGNWHHTAFTQDVLARHLERNGFENVRVLEREHQTANWNFKLQVTKSELKWGDQ